MTATQPAARAANILVVDDTPANLQLLSNLLGQYGFFARVAISGSLALRAARLMPPDLILLDVRMPKMDGYEVCARLKADEQLKHIPVIFVSAHGETDEKVRAFQVGGVDYVTKPFQAEEVRARVCTQLEMYRLQQEIRGQNSRLEDLVHKRTRQLEETNSRLAVLDQAKTDFLTAISHELRTPLNGLFGAVDLAFSESAPQPAMAEYQKIFESSRQRILQLVEDALLLADIQINGQAFAQNACSLDAVVGEACAIAGETVAPLNVTIGPSPTGLGEVAADPALLCRALTCLIETGSKFSHPGQRVTVTSHVTADEVCIFIKARGHSVPTEELPRFFQVLAICKTLTPSGDLGLSPAIAAQIIKLLGGRLEISNLTPDGIELHACLPRYRADVAMALPVNGDFCE